MNVREKLMELLKNAKSAMKSENLSCDIARNMFVVDFMMAHSVTVQEWISVDDKLPEESGFYLVFADLERSEVLPYSKKYQAFNAFDDNYSEENVIPVTHWMPMPELPEMEKAEE